MPESSPEVKVVTWAILVVTGAIGGAVAGPFLFFFVTGGVLGFGFDLVVAAVIGAVAGAGFLVRTLMAEREWTRKRLERRIKRARAQQEYERRQG